MMARSMLPLPAARCLVGNLSLLFLTVCVLLVIAPPVDAQSLLVNSTFDNDLSFWGTYAFPADWDPLDAGGSATSGSFRGINDEGSPSSATIATQCVVVSPNTTYELAGDYFVPSGQGMQVNAELLAYVYANPTCNLSPINSAYLAVPVNLDTWTRAETTVFTQATGESVSFRIQVYKDSATSGATAYADDLWLAPVGGLFFDGFETGDTRAW